MTILMNHKVCHSFIPSLALVLYGLSKKGKAKNENIREIMIKKGGDEEAEEEEQQQQ